MQHQTHVSFYIIGEGSAFSDKYLTACKLIAKAIKTDNVSVLLHEQDTASFDDLLWSYDPTSFITHGINLTAQQRTHHHVNLIPQAPAMPAQDTLQLSASEHTTHLSGILVNLTQHAIALPTQEQQPISRIIELVTPDTPSKEQGRIRYKHYKNAGLQLKTFSL